MFPAVLCSVYSEEQSPGFVTDSKLLAPRAASYPLIRFLLCGTALSQPLHPRETSVIMVDLGGKGVPSIKHGGTRNSRA